MLGFASALVLTFVVAQAITDKTLDTLSSVYCKTSLQTLSLTGCAKVTDAGLKHIGALDCESLSPDLTWCVPQRVVRR